ncbi:DUF4148 domain-containing protein [Bordetella muralis]|uniref:DUF4148 domain-containing protein n=1 Tax=Bordetella muralis TaxID=1649130 RepID=UPI0039F0D4AD
MKIALTGLIVFSALIGTANADGGNSEPLTQLAANEASFGEAPSPLPEPIVNTKTRADVRAELAAARAAGQISDGEAPYPVPAAIASNKSRAEVRSELADAKAQGLITYGEQEYPVAQHG